MIFYKEIDEARKMALIRSLKELASEVQLYHTFEHPVITQEPENSNVYSTKKNGELEKGVKLFSLTIKEDGKGDLFTFLVENNYFKFILHKELGEKFNISSPGFKIYSWFKYEKEKGEATLQIPNYIFGLKPLTEKVIQ